MATDLKDLRILANLERNARTPIVSLAKAVRLHPDVVRYRIAKMESDRIIKGYYAIVNTHKLGYTTYRVVLKLIDNDIAIENELISYLDKELSAGQIFTIDGEYQIGFIVWERSIYALEEKLRGLRSKFDRIIEGQQITIFTKLNHYCRKDLPGASGETISLGQETPVLLDDEDLFILKELSKNARISSVELAQKHKMPQRTVAYRIKRLEKERFILGYRIDIDTTSLGYNNFFLEVYTHNPKDTAKIEQYAKQHTNILYTDYVLLGADIELELELKGKQAVWQLIRKLREAVPSIKTVKCWSTIEYKKINYLP